MKIIFSRCPSHMKLYLLRCRHGKLHAWSVWSTVDIITKPHTYNTNPIFFRQEFKLHKESQHVWIGFMSHFIQRHSCSFNRKRASQCVHAPADTLWLQGSGKAAWWHSSTNLMAEDVDAIKYLKKLFKQPEVWREVERQWEKVRVEEL